MKAVWFWIVLQSPTIQSELLLKHLAFNSEWVKDWPFFIHKYSCWVVWGQFLVTTGRTFKLEVLFSCQRRKLYQGYFCKHRGHRMAKALPSWGTCRALSLTSHAAAATWWADLGHGTGTQGQEPQMPLPPIARMGTMKNENTYSSPRMKQKSVSRRPPWPLQLNACIHPNVWAKGKENMGSG